jgi:hypothetical protein
VNKLRRALRHLQLWTSRPLTTWENGQPYITYVYLDTDAWTRITGRAGIRMRCGLCDTTEVARLPIPRFGKVPEPQGGRHPARLAFMDRHQHVSLRGEV